MVVVVVVVLVVVVVVVMDDQRRSLNWPKEVLISNLSISRGPNQSRMEKLQVWVFHEDQLRAQGAHPLSKLASLLSRRI